MLASPLLYQFVIQPYRKVIATEARIYRTILDAAPEAIFEVDLEAEYSY